MNTRKYVLVIAQDGSPLESVVAPMEALHFRITRVRSRDAAIQFVSDTSRLSAVVMDGEIPDALEVLAMVKDRHGELPVIWWQPNDQRPRFIGASANVVVRGALDPADLVERTRQRFYDDFYPGFVIQSLYNATNSVLATTFQVAVDLGEPWIEFSEGLPGNAAALIGFGGTDVAGHLLVVGNKLHLAHLAEEIGCDPNDGERRLVIDILGELSNQILGQVKAACAELLGTVQLGLPYVVLGERMDLHFGTTKPFVRMVVSVRGSDIYVDFALQKLNIADTDQLGKDLVGAGKMTLF